MSKFLFTTDKRALDVQELAALLAATGQNCDQFPSMSKAGGVLRVSSVRLRRAIRFSDIAVAVYIKGRSIPGGDYMKRMWSDGNDQQGVFEVLFPQSGPKCLVAFGRAISDTAMAASIHDLAVAPSMQRRGLGGQVLQRIVRYLYNQRNIPDISVLTRPENLPFFESCGFKPDVLCSTTMLYTKAAVRPEDDVKHVGRLALQIPALSMKTNFGRRPV